jgi:hypothetical protein
VLDPRRVIHRVQILVSKVGGDGNNDVTRSELWSELLDGGQHRSGASADKQVMISDERKTGVDCGRLVDCDYSIRMRKIGERRPHAGADARDMPFPGRAPKCA